MIDDPIGLLERELVEAARRQAGGARARRVHRIARGLPAAAVLVATLLIAGGALILRW